MSTDWLSPLAGGVVGLAGLLFGWLTSKQSREQAERLAAQANENARLLAEQSNTHARRVEEERWVHTARLARDDRRQQQIRDAYVKIMTTVVLINESISGRPQGDREGRDAGAGAAPDGADLAQASALAETFASDEVLRLFGEWREIVAAAHQAIDRIHALQQESPAAGAKEADRMWRKRLRDLGLRAADARQALADAVASEVGARGRRKDDLAVGVTCASRTL